MSPLQGMPTFEESAREREMVLRNYRRRKQAAQTAADGSRGRGSSATRSPAPPRSPQPLIEPGSPAAGVASGPGFWGVVVIALLLVALTGATGHWSTGFWIALLVLLLVGAIFPLPALVFGGLALLYLTFTHGRAFIDNVTALVSSKPASQGGHA